MAFYTVDVENGGTANRSVQAKNVMLATGSEARMIPGLKPDDRILTNIEILSLQDIPKSLIDCRLGRRGRGVRVDLQRHLVPRSP